MLRIWIAAICVCLTMGAPLTAGTVPALARADPVTPGPISAAAPAPLVPAILAVPPYTRMVFNQGAPQYPWNSQIFTALSDEQPAARLTTNGANDIQPRLNRSASRIVFASDRDGNYNIFAMDVDGGNVTRVTTNAAHETEPSWSPDGARITFSSSRNGHSDIYVIDADGANETRLTTDAGEDSQPAWSPDGSLIAFASTRAAPSAGTHVWLMAANGDNQHLMQTEPWGRYPLWSPDGQTIIFQAWTYSYIPAGGVSSVNRDGGSASVLIPAADMFEYYDILPCDAMGGRIAFMVLDQLYFTAPWGWYATGVSGIPCPDYQPLDLTPPSTRLDPLPASSPADIVVSWSGSANDGPVAEFTYEIQWRDGISGAWNSWTSASHTAPLSTTFRGLGGHTYYFRVRGVDVVGNAEPWPADADASTTIEALPPATTLTLTDLRPASFSLNLNWSATDAGGSPIAGYDVEYRIEPATTWTRLFTQTTQTSTVFPFDVARVYHFRARAVDGANNTEPWPAGNEGSHTFPPLMRFAGGIFDGAGIPVRDGSVNLRSADLVLSAASDMTGRFDLQLRPRSPVLSVTVSKGGYGSLPEMVLTSAQDGQWDYYLPPFDNIVTNWGFESPLSATAWLSDGISKPHADARGRHTGALGVSVGGLRNTGPANVSRSSTDSSAPALASGPDGQLDAAWIERNGDIAEARHSRRAPNGEWSDPATIIGSLMPASLTLPSDYRPDLALDAAGAAHILWRTWPQGTVYYGTQPAGGSWSLYLVATGLDDGSLPRLAVDPAGNAHLTWQFGNGSRRDIFAVRRGADGLWSAIKNITAQDPYLVDARNPVIAVDITGTAYLAWENGTGFFARRPVGGDWSAPSPVLAWPFNLSRPQLAVDADGTAHAAWQAATTGKPSAIAYASFRSGLVSQPVVVYTDTAPITLKRLVIDSVGAPHLAWTSGDAAVFHGTPNTGGGWAITRLSTLATWTNGVIDLAPAAAGVWAAWSAEDPARIFEGGCAQWTSAGGWKDFGGCGAPWRATPALGVGSDGQIHLAFSPRDDDQRDVWHLSWPDAPVGPSRISQRLTLPVTLTSPGLSFLYRIDGSATDAQAAFTVTAETDLGAIAVYTSLETPGTPWQHVWRDMSAYAGQSITLSFAIDPRDGSGGARLALDEVSLGSTAPDLWVESALPAEIRPETAQTMTLQYGNWGGGLAAGASITLTLPPGLTLDSAEPPPSSAAPELVWQLPSILPGAVGPSIVLTLSIDPGAAGATLTPTIVIDSTTPELELANNAWRAAVFVGYRAHLPLIQSP